jgi:hypothetical protein
MNFSVFRSIILELCEKHQTFAKIIFTETIGILLMA